MRAVLFIKSPPFKVLFMRLQAKGVSCPPGGVLMATNRTMYLYHVTHRNNWFSIGVLGLLQEFTSGKTQGIFLVSSERLQWAHEHVAGRIGCGTDELMIVKVRVRRSRLTPVRFRTARRGLWRHNGDINPCRIEEINTYPVATPRGELPKGVNPSRGE